MVVIVRSPYIPLTSTRFNVQRSQDVTLFLRALLEEADRTGEDVHVMVTGWPAARECRRPVEEQAA